MSWKKHQTKSFRKLITYEEMADYTGVTRNTVINHLKKYKLENEYDPKDIYSVFDFFLYLLMINIGLNNNNKVPPYIFLVSIFKGLLRERKK
jgi:transcriptional antiterminator